MLIKTLLAYIIAGFVGLLLANLLIADFTVQGEFSESVKVLLLAGVLLGLINFFIKPVLNLITLPLRWFTFGLFGLVINILIIWLIDIVFSPQLTIVGLKALFLTSLLVWLVNLIVPKTKKRR